MVKFLDDNREAAASLGEKAEAFFECFWLIFQIALVYRDMPELPVIYVIMDCPAV